MQRPRATIAILTPALLLAAPATAQPGSDDHDWPMFGRDHANSVHATAETAIGPANVADLTERWRIDGIGGVTGTPAVVDGVVYFGDFDGDVRAVEAIDGDLVWQSSASGVAISASVAVGPGLVLAADLEGMMHAFDRTSGTLAWSSPLDPLGASAFGSPVIIDDTVVIGLTDTEVASNPEGLRGSVVALHVADGSELWRFRTDAGTAGPDTWVSVWSSAAYDPETSRVFIGTGDTNDPTAPFERSPVDDAHANAIIAIDHETGEPAWVTRVVEVDEGQDLDVGAAPNLFTIDGRPVVGAGSKAGDYTVLDRRTGERLWRAELTDGGPAGGVMATAAVDEERIYVVSNAAMMADASIFALDAEDGTVIWHRVFDAPVLGGSLALANGVLYRGLWDGTIVALDAETGDELWSSDLGHGAAGGVAVSDGAIFLGFGTPGSAGSLNAAGGIVAFALP